VAHNGVTVARMIPTVPTDAILISRLELTARNLILAAHTLPLDMTDDERVLLSKEINAAGEFIRRINHILAGRPIAVEPVESWDEPPSVL